MAVYTVWKAKRKGKIHGRDWRWGLWPFWKNEKPVIPADDCRDVTNYEKSIINAAQSEMARLREKFYARDARLKNRYCFLKRMEKELEERAPKEKLEAMEARKQFEEAQNRLAALGQPVIKEWVVRLILFLLIITEFPLNALVFAVFGEGKILTYIMAGVIGFGIPFGAHYIGKVIRQDYKNRKDVVMSTIITLLVISVIIGIAVLRADYLSYVLSSYNININISSGTASLIFVGINLFLFFLAVFISYLGTHRNHEEYVKLKGQLRIARARWQKESGEDIEIMKKLSKVSAKLSEIKARRECLSNSYYNKAVRLKESAENLIQIYRNANIESRPNAHIPPCFKKELTIEVPEDIRHLSWDCD